MAKAIDLNSFIEKIKKKDYVDYSSFRDFLQNYKTEQSDNYINEQTIACLIKATSSDISLFGNLITTSKILLSIPAWIAFSAGISEPFLPFVLLTTGIISKTSFENHNQLRITVPIIMSIPLTLCTSIEIINNDSLALFKQDVEQCLLVGESDLT